MSAPPSRRAALIAFFVMCALLAITAYLSARIFIFIDAPNPLYERILASLLLLAEAFILVHTSGYLINVLRVAQGPKGGRLTRENAPPLEEYPPIAVIVSSFKEPLHIVEDTLLCFRNMTYPNKRLYFLDDTRYDASGWKPGEAEQYRASIDALCEELEVNVFRRSWRGAKAGMVNDFLEFVAGRHKQGFEFTAHGPSDADDNAEPSKYIVLFDADQNPFPDFAEPLVAHMEARPGMAFIQTPQYYTNFETNRVARASGLQQAVFYEYICEGKGTRDAMICCGTNVIFRREALEDVGGFEEGSVTEDFATSVKFHANGWHSGYSPHKGAFGMGPEDLGAYFKQQFRWALGTVGILRRLFAALLTGRVRLNATRLWEYCISGSYYFIGWVFVIMMICPPLFLLFSVPTFFSQPEIYLLIFAPYFVLCLSLFFYTLAQRRYRIFGLISGIVLQTVSFPVYMMAASLGILGYKGSFETTPKGAANYLPMIALWPQLGLALLNVAAAAWGVCRLYFEREPVGGLAVNIIWCLYHTGLLVTVLYFNHPEENTSSEQP